jgi:ribosomal protein S2
MFSYEIKTVIWQLLLYGVHVGHSFQNSILYSGWFIYTYNFSMFIINLYKTILGLKNGNLGYDYCSKIGAPVWFINLNRAFEIYVNDSALRCGEFAYTTYWIHGMISNYGALAETYHQLAHYTEDAHKGQFAKLEMDASPWFFSRWSWPRSSCISSVATTEWPSKECLTSRVPSVGVVDTDIPGHISNIATPGNDDSLDSQIFFLTVASLYLLEKKYSEVIGWWHHVKKQKRKFSFYKWILQFFVLYDGTFNYEQAPKSKVSREVNQKMLDNTLSFVFSYWRPEKYFGEGMKYFFAPGSGDDQSYFSLELDEPIDEGKDYYDYVKTSGKFKKRSFYLCRILNFYLLKGLWHSSCTKIVTRKYKSLRWFKYFFLARVYKEKLWDDNFLDTNFLYNRFWRNRIFKTYLRRRKFRRNIFLIKFFKFLNITRFNSKRGFMDRSASNFLNVSSYAKVAFHYAFNYYKKQFYTDLLSKNNDILSISRKKKYTFFLKWLHFKREAKKYASKTIFKRNYNIDLRYANMYNVYSQLKKSLVNKYRVIYAYFNFYFSMWYWNKAKFLYQRRHRNWILLKKFRALKHLSKLFKYISLFKKAILPFKVFNNWYLNKKDTVLFKDILNFSYAKIFSFISWNSRKYYFSKYFRYRYFRVKKVKRYFRRFKRYCWKVYKENRVIFLLKGKHNKFRDTKKVKRKVASLLYISFRNKYIYFYTKKDKIKYKSCNFINFTCKYWRNNQKLARFNIYHALKYKPDLYFLQNSNYALNKQYNNFVYLKHKLVYKNLKEVNIDLFHKLFNNYISIFSNSFKYISYNLLKYDFFYFTENVRLLLYVNLTKKFRDLKTNIGDEVSVSFLKELHGVIVDLKKVMKKGLGRNGIYMVWGYRFSNLSYNFCWSFIKKNYLKFKGIYAKDIKKLKYNKNYIKKKKKSFRRRDKFNNLFKSKKLKYLNLKKDKKNGFYYYYYYLKSLTTFQKYYSFFNGSFLVSYSRKQSYGKLNSKNYKNVIWS